MNRLILAAGAAMLVLGGCAKSIEAPSEAGVCYNYVTPQGGEPKFNKLADHIADIEHCALQLELVRRNFRSLGSVKDEYIGAFQGSFVFIENDGIFTAQKFDGIRYPLLVRFQGELVAPSAIVEGKAPPGTNELK